MEYRTLPHGGERIGVIGMGSSVIGARPESEIIGTVRAAVELGVNCFDMAGGHAAIFGAYGKACRICETASTCRFTSARTIQAANTAGRPTLRA